MQYSFVFKRFLFKTKIHKKNGYILCAIDGSKIEINKKTTEYIISNLDKNEFCNEDLKEIYGKRWQLEKEMKKYVSMIRKIEKVVYENGHQVTNIGLIIKQVFKKQYINQ